MSSRVYDFSNNYDCITQKKCPRCGIIYDLEPEYKYEYDNWYLGDFGCHSPIEHKTLIGYKDEGCPHCRERKNRAIEEFEKRLKKCSVCGKAKIKVYTTDSYKDCYGISCDCVSTRAKFTYEWIPRLIGIWNKSH